MLPGVSMQQSRLKSGAETTSRLLEALSRPGALERAREGEQPLRAYVESEARDLPPGQHSRQLWWLLCDGHVAWQSSAAWVQQWGAACKCCATCASMHCRQQ